MVTDDPGTPGDGHWEINAAGFLSTTPNQQLLALPYFDINYGWGDHVQLKIETGWMTSWEPQSTTDSGFDTGLVGVKYRFLDEDKAGFAMSIYPQALFHHLFSSKDPELNVPGDQYIFPVEWSKTIGNWEFNPEVGYLYSTQVSNQIFYGIVVAYETFKPWELLGEVHVNAHLDGSGSSTLLNVGLRRTLTENIALLAAVGRTVTQARGADPEWDFYLGLQFTK